MKALCFVSFYLHSYIYTHFQVTYAIGTACEVAYKSYVFVAVTKEEYSTVSLYLAGSTLFGRSMSSFASQILHDYAGISFMQLNYISLASVSLALILALVIPAPLHFVGSNENSTIQPSSDQDQLILDDDISMLQKVKEKFVRGKTNVMLSYKSLQTRRWAYWAIVTSALYFMVSRNLFLKTFFCAIYVKTNCHTINFITNFYW